MDLNKMQTVTPAQCALVTTSQYVNLPNARPIAVESGRVVKNSVSSAERRRRYDAALAICTMAEKRVQLAEAHVAFITSRDQPSAGSPTDTALLPSQDGVCAPFRASRSALCIPSNVGNPESLVPTQVGPAPERTPPPSQGEAPPPIQPRQVTSECRTVPAGCHGFAPCAVAIYYDISDKNVRQMKEERLRHNWAKRTANEHAPAAVAAAARSPPPSILRSILRRSKPQVATAPVAVLGWAPPIPTDNCRSWVLDGCNWRLAKKGKGKGTGDKKPVCFDFQVDAVRGAPSVPPAAAAQPLPTQVGAVEAYSLAPIMTTSTSKVVTLVSRDCCPYLDDFEPNISQSRSTRTHKSEREGCNV